MSRFVMIILMGVGISATGLLALDAGEPPTPIQATSGPQVETISFWERPFTEEDTRICIDC
jgi:hypothetical protein